MGGTYVSEEYATLRVLLLAIEEINRHMKAQYNLTLEEVTITHRRGRDRYELRGYWGK